MPLSAHSLSSSQRSFGASFVLPSVIPHQQFSKALSISLTSRFSLRRRMSASFPPSPDEPPSAEPLPVLPARLEPFRCAIDPAGMIWVSWPKKSSGVATDVTEDVVRQIALPLGLVDIKVCAVDEVWSGLKLMIRKELR